MFDMRPIARCAELPAHRELSSIVYRKPAKAPRRPLNTSPKCQCGNCAGKDGFCRRCRSARPFVPRQKKLKRQKANQKLRPAKKHVEKLKIHGYGKRDAILKGMGFASYSDYLKSDLWKSIRSRVLKTNANCLKCSGLATQVHHSTYLKENLTGESLSGLHSVCHQCHKWAEFDEAGNKLSLSAANARLGITRPKVYRAPTTKKGRRELRSSCLHARKLRKRSCCPKCGTVVLHRGKLCTLCLTKRAS